MPIWRMNSSFSETKKEMRQYYSMWSTTNSFSPAFREVIYITNRGWNHLVGNNSKKREYKDVLRRLKLLKCAREILELATTIQDVRKCIGGTYYAIEAVLFPIAESLVKVRVIIFENNDIKKKIFLSVMTIKAGKMPHP